MKRRETLELEEALHKQTKKKRIYGCEEITIGFPSSKIGKGREIVDFMTMDSKGIIKCYEIKVTLQDLKSSAKKSFYGHYNYLVVSDDLVAKIDDYSKYIPSYTGVIYGNNLYSLSKAKKQTISREQESILKESMIRSIYWKMDKYKNINDMVTYNKLTEKIKWLENEIKDINEYHSETYRENRKLKKLLKENKIDWKYI